MVVGKVYSTMFYLSSFLHPLNEGVINLFLQCSFLLAYFCAFMAYLTTSARPLLSLDKKMIIITIANMSLGHVYKPMKNTINHWDHRRLEHWQCNQLITHKVIITTFNLATDQIIDHVYATKFSMPAKVINCVHQLATMACCLPTGTSYLLTVWVPPNMLSLKKRVVRMITRTTVPIKMTQALKQTRITMTLMMMMTITMTTTIPIIMIQSMLL